jgi:hypothetical protein
VFHDSAVRAASDVKSAVKMVAATTRKLWSHYLYIQISFDVTINKGTDNKTLVYSLDGKPQIGTLG